MMKSNLGIMGIRQYENYLDYPDSVLTWSELVALLIAMAEPQAEFAQV